MDEGKFTLIGVPDNCRAEPENAGVPKRSDFEPDYFLVQGWNRGMKLSIADPLPNAKSVGVLKWLCFRLQPKFRHYQRWEVGVGTKAWAAAQSARDF